MESELSIGKKLPRDNKVVKYFRRNPKPEKNQENLS